MSAARGWRGLARRLLVGGLEGDQRAQAEVEGLGVEGEHQECAGAGFGVDDLALEGRGECGQLFAHHASFGFVEDRVDEFVDARLGFGVEGAALLAGEFLADDAVFFARASVIVTVHCSAVVQRHGASAVQVFVDASARSCVPDMPSGYLYVTSLVA